MSRRNHATRRRAYGRRQHELRERRDNRRQVTDWLARATEALDDCWPASERVAPQRKRERAAA